MNNLFIQMLVTNKLILKKKKKKINKQINKREARDIEIQNHKQAIHSNINIQVFKHLRYVLQ